MDERVIAAMARWPNVPDVFGWLSLNAGGHWRLHSAGDALDNRDAESKPGDGEPITSTRINQFINRNYARDTLGRWYFQNGPQRVYIRLDVAPYVFHTTDSELARPAFLTHNGIRTAAVTRWCLDDQGHLYADTDQGAGLIASRDLTQVMDQLTAAHGGKLLGMLENLEFDGVTSIDVGWSDGSVAPLYMCRFDSVADLLGFARYPRPD